MTTDAKFSPTPCTEPTCEPKRWAADIGTTIWLRCSTCDAKWQAASDWEADCPHEMTQVHNVDVNGDHQPTWVQAD